MDRSGFHYDAQALAAWCQRRNVARLLLLDTAHPGQARPTARMDLVVEFLPRTGFGAYLLVRMELELAEIFGQRPVDLLTVVDLPDSSREATFASALTLFPPTGQ